MRKRRLINTEPLHEKASPLVKLWALRMLVKLGGHHRFISGGEWRDEELACALGLPAINESPDDDRQVRAFEKKALNELKKLHQETEHQVKSTGIELPEILEKNARRLANHLGLGELDRKIMAFAALLHNDSVLGNAADCMGDMKNARMFSCLAAILDSDSKSVRDVLSSNSKLCSSGIISVKHDFDTEMKNRLELISSEFSDRMTASEQDPIDLIRDRVFPSKAPTLSMKDYEHLSKDVSLLGLYLKEALQSNRAGVNIFVYGPPGTGKSELARLMAQTCDVTLYEIASEDSDGDPINGQCRLRAYRAAMSFFTNHKAIVLFDEVEDIFHDGGFFGRSTAANHKAWLNHALEESPVPTIWLSNSGQGIDPAFIRRYDITFKLDIAPQCRRKEILQDLAGEYLSPADIDIASQSDHLAPAVISRATSVLNTLKENLPKDEWSSSLMRLMNNTLETQGHERVKNRAGQIPSYYDPAFINANANLEDIASGLRQAPGARICLYGPPGTGKSAYGYWLASVLKKPILVKRASDLISMWVGQTEKNIAAAFQEAENEESILLIDEVESFLSDRRQSSHSWETSTVNEMLTQMENFSGIFVASTNLMEGLDQAAFRRFDLKLKFDYLLPEQAWSLLCAQCQTLDIEPPQEADKSRLSSLKILTPGDLAVVARRHRLSKYRNASEVIDQLRLEASLKDDARTGRSIGFIG